MKALTLLRFSRAEMLFSAKAFASAIMAITIAQWAGLPRPFWAMMTAYIVASPLAGAVRSKAFFRFCGTLVGCLVTLLVVPLLSNAPELMTLVLALWLAACLYVSMLDRTPRAYVFMLAGYTASLIGFPSVETPLMLFDTASARVEEILLGILCATLVHSLVLPTGLAPTVLGLLDRSLVDARRWFSDLMQGPARAGAPSASATPGTPLDADRRRLAADITLLRTLSTHVPFDTTHLRLTTATLHTMQNGMASLTSLFSAVEDRLRALQEAEGTLPADVQTVLHDMGRWVESGAHTDPQATEALRQAIRALSQDDTLQGCTAWTRALRLAVSTRLAQLLDGWLECIALRREVNLGLDGTLVSRAQRTSASTTLHHDHGLATLSAASAFLAVCISCAFWMVTGWPMGSVATMMTAILCCLFASMDDPAPAIHIFLKYTVWSMPVAGFYVLVLMPLVRDTLTLTLVCAPLFLVTGALMARPDTALPATAVVLSVTGTLSGHDTANGDFVSFINITTAQVLGVSLAALTTRLVRSVGADWMARRIQRATWRELAELAAGRHDTDHSEGYMARTLDRIGLLAARIAQVDHAPAEVATTDALRELRLGADLITLQRHRGHLPSAAAPAVTALLTGIARFFQQRGHGRAVARPSELQAHIDTALSALLSRPHLSAAQDEVVAALVGLRRSLCREAPSHLTSPHPAEPTPSTRKASPA